ncbi:unnamed protein product [Acanthosepion pharaonis]|uniref:Uncharacterized protein n=1 Tax=Acanthosepion pharaonis TaxID=158019 RepID=A0A812AWX4_ACAPH|nr:unnamed protein product [Sepia pharaonis]
MPNLLHGTKTKRPSFCLTSSFLKQDAIPTLYSFSLLSSLLLLLFSSIAEWKIPLSSFYGFSLFLPPLLSFSHSFSLFFSLFPLSFTLSLSLFFSLYHSFLLPPSSLYHSFLPPSSLFLYIFSFQKLTDSRRKIYSFSLSPSPSLFFALFLFIFLSFPSLVYSLSLFFSLYPPFSPFLSLSILSPPFLSLSLHLFVSEVNGQPKENLFFLSYFCLSLTLLTLSLYSSLSLSFLFLSFFLPLYHSLPLYLSLISLTSPVFLSLYIFFFSEVNGQLNEKNPFSLTFFLFLSLLTLSLFFSVFISFSLFLFPLTLTLPSLFKSLLFLSLSLHIYLFSFRKLTNSRMQIIFLLSFCFLVLSSFHLCCTFSSLFCIRLSHTSFSFVSFPSFSFMHLFFHISLSLLRRFSFSFPSFLFSFIDSIILFFFFFSSPFLLPFPCLTFLLYLASERTFFFSSFSCPLFFNRSFDGLRDDPDTSHSEGVSRFLKRGTPSSLFIRDIDKSAPLKNSDRLRFRVRFN